MFDILALSALYLYQNGKVGERKPCGTSRLSTHQNSENLLLTSSHGLGNERAGKNQVQHVRQRHRRGIGQQHGCDTRSAAGEDRKEARRKVLGNQRWHDEGEVDDAP